MSVPNATELLKEAFEAGMAAQRKTDAINKLLEDGTKQCPAFPTFESWLYGRDETREKGASREVSAAVTPLSWEACCQKIAEKHGSSSWNALLRFTIYRSGLYFEDIQELIKGYESEAAQLFMSSNRDAKS